jgi:hypothetical protein
VRDVAAGEVARLGGSGLADADSRGGSNGTVDIVACDAAVAARALDAGWVDVVLEKGSTD